MGGFPELALSEDDAFSQRMLREEVVDKVMNNDVLTAQGALRITKRSGDYGVNQFHMTVQLCGSIIKSKM